MPNIEQLQVAESTVQQMQAAVRLLIDNLGEDASREGLLDTPRVGSFSFQRLDNFFEYSKFFKFSQHQQFLVVICSASHRLGSTWQPLAMPAIAVVEPLETLSSTSLSYQVALTV